MKLWNQNQIAPKFDPGFVIGCKVLPCTFYLNIYFDEHGPVFVKDNPLYILMKTKIGKNKEPTPCLSIVEVHIIRFNWNTFSSEKLAGFSLPTTGLTTCEC